jgi:hypothetical protein
MAKIKTRDEILNDVIKDGKKYPKNWKAVIGKDNKRLSQDYYIFNPNTGIYLLKEYQKNPFVIKGIGEKIARKVDEDIESEMSKSSTDFGIIQGDFNKILKNLDKGIKPQKIFDSAIKGKKDLGIKMPVRGHASSSKDVFDDVHNILSNKQKKIDKKFEKIATDDGLYSSYG